MFSKKLADRLKRAYHITILTGAGISKESGVPTFRGKDGLWNNYQVQQLATPETMHNEPELFWRFYHWRRKLLSDVKPNLGHYACVDMENHFGDFTLITQNVDNLHRQAGSSQVLELHGNINRSLCTSCSFSINSTSVPEEFDGVPKCPECGAMLRPDVVLFGEPLPENIINEAQQSSASCEVFISVGTSAVVQPAASLPFIAKANGAYVLEINKEETALTASADETIFGESGKILPLLVILLDKIS